MTDWITSVIPEKKEPLPYVTLFRRTLTLSDVLPVFVKITADTRYKLYVNGQFAEYGPSRGDESVWFYDEIDLTRYLHAGKNVICAAVLRNPEDTAHSNHGMARTAIPGLYAALFCDGAELPEEGSWKWKRAEGISFCREEVRFAPLNIHEKAWGDPSLAGWNTESFDDSSWQNAVSYSQSQLPLVLQPDHLVKRTIPFMKRVPRRFPSIRRIIFSSHSVSAWEAFLSGETALVIPKGTTETVEIDAGEEMTGYLSLCLAGGRAAEIELLYSEAYVQEGFEGPEQHPVKKDREDSICGHLDGYADTYRCAGYGTTEKPEEYTPYWFRTFRFIRITVSGAEEPLTLCSLNYEETGYPLEIKTRVNSSDASLSDIWDISARTLRRCMQETYIDCPFYEQLQYIADARLEILYTYAVSADDRLARKCIDDLARSQREDGLLNASYPNRTVNVIPTFSMYFILMVYDHLLYFGDRDFAARFIPVIRKILAFFEAHTSEEGYVGSIGGLNGKAPFWSYIDWAAEWNDTSGMPAAGLQGPITMESLLYLYGLKHAILLADELGFREDCTRWTANSLRAEAALRKYCMGKNGMIMDGPGVETYSQHCQIFGILTGILNGEQANAALQEASRPGYAQSSIAMRYYLFRALEICGLYEETDRYYEPWRNMVKQHCTTCVESEAYARSECHAWGALVLYELPSSVLGVRPASFGYKTVRISPLPGRLTQASGDVITPNGTVHVEWTLKNGKPEVSYTLPEGLSLQN